MSEVAETTYKCADILLAAGLGSAIKAGADYIVVGRPIWNAKDPILAVNEILKDMCI